MRQRRRAVPIEIFLSHSDRDRSFTLKLAKALRRRGIPVWCSRTHVRGAHQWHDEIGRALERCDWFLVLLSPNSVRSEWVKRELVYALNEDRYRGRIVPLILKKCNFARLSWTLAQFQQLDFTKGLESCLPPLLAIWEVLPNSARIRNRKMKIRRTPKSVKKSSS